MPDGGSFDNTVPGYAVRCQIAARPNRENRRDIRLRAQNTMARFQAVPAAGLPVDRIVAVREDSGLGHREVQGFPRGRILADLVLAGGRMDEVWDDSPKDVLGARRVSARQRGVRVIQDFSLQGTPTPAGVSFPLSEAA